MPTVCAYTVTLKYHGIECLGFDQSRATYSCTNLVVVGLNYDQLWILSGVMMVISHHEPFAVFPTPLVMVLKCKTMDKSDFNYISPRWAWLKR